jgi:hypothetical protein
MLHATMRILTLLAVTAALAGCVVYDPGPGYGYGYAAPPPAVYGPPVYGSVVIGGGGGWHHWH